MRMLIATAVFLLASVTTIDESHGWAVVYLEKKVDPTQSHLMVCSDANRDCNVVYQDVEATVWFHSRQEALDFVNGFYDVWLGVPLARVYLNSNDPVPPRPMSKERIIGIFECKRLPIHLAKIGTHKVTIQEPKEVEQDIQEWKPQ